MTNNSRLLGIVSCMPLFACTHCTSRNSPVCQYFLWSDQNIATHFKWELSPWLPLLKVLDDTLEKSPGCFNHFWLAGQILMRNGYGVHFKVKQKSILWDIFKQCCQYPWHTSKAYTITGILCKREAEGQFEPRRGPTYLLSWVRDALVVDTSAPLTRILSLFIT